MRIRLKYLLLARSRLILCAVFLVAITSRSAPPQIQVELGEVKDIRPNGKETGQLELELKIKDGEMQPDAKGCRITLTKVVDDTGLDLLRPESASSEFRPTLANAKFTLKLKSPDRKADRIREISGDVEMLVPQNDPAATVVESSFRRNAGKPIKSEILKSSGIELTAWSQEQYKVLIKKREAEELKRSEDREREAIRTVEAQAAKSPNGVDQQAAIVKIKAEFARQRQMQAVFRQGDIVDAPKASDIAFSIEDPGKRLVGIEFRDAADEPIRSTGTNELNRQHDSKMERTRIYHFQSPLPATAKLVIFVATSQSLVKTPFTLTDVTLP